MLKPKASRQGLTEDFTVHRPEQIYTWYYDT